MKRSHRVALRPTAEQRVAVPAARRLCAIRLQLGRRGIQGWPGRWRVAVRADVAAALEPGQWHHSAVGRAAVAERPKYAIIDSWGRRRTPGALIAIG